MMTIQPENKAYVLQFSVTENQAKKVRVGDTAEILNNWYGNDVSAVVSAIRKDPQNRSNSIIICEMKGDVSVGDSYTRLSGSRAPTMTRLYRRVLSGKIPMENSF